MTVPPGAWAVAVSGGADSVALLRLAGQRADLRLWVVHLDHETRQGQSTLDAHFVAALAERGSLPVTVARRGEVEATLDKLPANRSAHHRALRLELFSRVVRRHDLQGVLLAHHADDQAETILQRLLRGSGASGLAGMSRDTRLGGLRILRPLLTIRRQALRDFLHQQQQPWAEDASNASPAYQRNRVRAALQRHPALVPVLLELGQTCQRLRQWLNETAPLLPATFDRRQLSDPPRLLADTAARRWLLQAGAPADAISAETLARLLSMARDAAAPPRQHFPGQLLVRRRQGKLWVEATQGQGSS